MSYVFRKVSIVDEMALLVTLKKNTVFYLRCDSKAFETDLYRLHI